MWYRRIPFATLSGDCGTGVPAIQAAAEDREAKNEVMVVMLPAPLRILQKTASGYEIASYGTLTIRCNLRSATMVLAELATLAKEHLQINLTFVGRLPID